MSAAEIGKREVELWPTELVDGANATPLQSGTKSPAILDRPCRLGRNPTEATLCYDQSTFLIMLVVTKPPGFTPIFGPGRRSRRTHEKRIGASLIFNCEGSKSGTLEISD